MRMTLIWAWARAEHECDFKIMRNARLWIDNGIVHGIHKRCNDFGGNICRIEGNSWWFSVGFHFERFFGGFGGFSFWEIFYGFQFESFFWCMRGGSTVQWQQRQPLRQKRKLSRPQTAEQKKNIKLSSLSSLTLSGWSLSSSLSSLTLSGWSLSFWWWSDLLHSAAASSRLGGKKDGVGCYHCYDCHHDHDDYDYDDDHDDDDDGDDGDALRIVTTHIL